MNLLAGIIQWSRSRAVPKKRSPENGLNIDTERTRHRRELARYQNQAGHNLTVQTTIDMARTQTWTGGG